ncbi:MAG: hypothetical protein ABL857_08340 [Rickettsiales bacterium]
MASETIKPRKWGVWILFASVPTLLCCALPILLVSLGMGSVAAAIYGKYFPFLRWFGFHENLTFGFTAFILLIAGWTLYRSGRTCPSDPELAILCNKAHNWNVVFYWGSVAIWCIGFVAAYVLTFLQ